ncbi:DUF3108 domain-containing protein [Frigidibacter oleivorans]|uniref:DUF3108 domain-containing protein n=1 Tax=Frigidibacter oleivorans TaxID=2487129 RepID=UPI000F8D15FB|nr:DUF3108 domain-containing protein [Frigidibacter oleivorans]
MTLPILPASGAKGPSLRRLLLAGAVLAVSALPLALPLAAQEQRDSAVYDLQLRGITAGTLTIDGRTAGGRYQATGRLQSSGLLAMLRKIRYDAEVRGQVAGGRLVPSRYVEAADTGRRQSNAVMDYVRGVPQVKEYQPPRKPDDKALDPATQAGTVDPMTAAFAVLRDVPADQACNRSLALFDGQRRTAVSLATPKAAPGGGVTCAGEYRRVAGFSADDMAEKTRFPFTLHLAPAGEGMLRVTQVTMDTIYGKGALKRR